MLRRPAQRPSTARVGDPLRTAISCFVRPETLLDVRDTVRKVSLNRSYNVQLADTGCDRVSRNRSSIGGGLFITAIGHHVFASIELGPANNRISERGSQRRGVNFLVVETTPPAYLAFEISCA